MQKKLIEKKKEQEGLRPTTTVVKCLLNLHLKQFRPNIKEKDLIVSYHSNKITTFLRHPEMVTK